MARTKKTEEMELNPTLTGEMLDQEAQTSESLLPGGEMPMLLDDPTTERLLTEGEEPSAQTDAEALPVMETDDTLPSEAEAPSDTGEPLPEEVVADAAVAAPEESESGEAPENSDVPQDVPLEEPAPDKPKRAAKGRKADTAPVENTSSAETKTNMSEAVQTKPAKRAVRKRTAIPDVLTIESRAEVETPEDREEIIWHEIHNAYRTRKILTGTLGGIEQTENGKTLAIVYYKEMRVIIPMKEMMIQLSQENAANYGDMMLRQNKILGTMLGAEIDFIVKGIEAKTRSVVASRRDAMLKKRQLFYMGTDANGMYRIYENRIVQARVIAVADKVIRVEIFGVECAIMARDLSWDWMGDAHERFSVGDEILVRILSVKRDVLEEISVKADVKSVSSADGRENLSKCKVQGKYAGKVTDIHKGTVFVRLSIGVNAIAHSCYDNRMPGKKDDVSFAVTHLDEEHGVAVGIITRIIKQNL